MTESLVFIRAVQRWLRGATRFLAPVLLGAILILIVLHIMNFGGRRESLAARAEAAFVRWSLVYGASSSPKFKSPVVTISAVDEDLPAIKLSPVRSLMDADISEYASVLEHAAANHPRWIVVSWLTYAHPLSPEYLRPLTAVIDRLGIRDRVTIAVNLYASETISGDFMRAYNIVEARDCYYEVNLFCTVLQDWSWMPQQVMTRFMTPNRPWVISKNLPHFLPNILLNLPDASQLTHYNFLDFKTPVMANIPDDAVIFIGNNMSQDFGFRDNKDALQKTYSANSDVSSTLMQDGVPWHVFWAQMAEMFIENRYISVLPDWAESSVIAFLMIAVLVGMYVSRRWTLWSLFAISVFVMIMNFLTVPIMSLYIPVMPLAMTVMTLFIGATFAAVAYSSYFKWRVQAETEIAESTTDIKQNFIHLISHNINTPIAQLRGILEIISDNHPDDRHLKQAMKVLELVRVTVRSVLNAATMSHQDPKIESCHFRSFIEAFNDEEGGFFRRIGIQIDWTPPMTDELHGEIWFYRFDLDPEMTKLCLLYAAVIVILRSRSEKIVIHCEPLNDEPGDPEGLRLHIRPEGVNSLQLAMPSDFAIEALTRFLQMASSRGFVTIDDTTSVLTLLFKSPAPN